MRTFRLFSIVLISALHIIPCVAQYDRYYSVGEEVYVVTTPKAIIYRMPDDYNNASLNCKRELIDTLPLKHKIIKKSQLLRVVRCTNVTNQPEFDAYLVEYKDKLWVVNRCYVQDNRLLEMLNNRLNQDKEELKKQYQDLSNRLSCLDGQLDSLRVVCIKECTDSLNYYKQLLSQLPCMRDSLLLAVKAQKQAIIDETYNKWYDEQPASTQKAAKALAIVEMVLGEPNYVGGCDYKFGYVNKSQKTIKYLYWTGTAYNAVNDPVCCDIRDTATCSGRDTGPIETGYRGGGIWECVVYNHSAYTLKLSRIKIEYMDGSTMSISAADIRRLVQAPSTSVFVSSYETKKLVMSDEICQNYISMWQNRLDKLNENDFTYSHNASEIYKDILARKNMLLSELGRLNVKVEKYLF